MAVGPLFVLRGKFMFDKDALGDLLRPVIEKEGYRLDHISYKMENGNRILRVVIDADHPISLQDIVSVNEKVSPLVDELDWLDDSYYLDVCSLGVEKPINLDTLEKYIDQYVSFHLSTPHDGDNYVQGTLKSVSEDTVVVETQVKANKKNVSVKRRQIDRGRLAIKF